jgi:uncharacterized membrane protein YjfL (UPF0719 family)
MSEDETVILIICGVIALSTWGAWFRCCCRVSHYLRLPRIRIALAAAPLVTIAILFGVLRIYADQDVRDSAIYLLFYSTMGAAWVGFFRLFLPVVGINPIDDGLHRRNPAAAIASVGMLFGLMACFAGANIGDGPGWWVVLFSALLPTVTLFLLWLILNAITRIAETITIDRNTAGAWRAAGFWVGSGTVLGRAAAGDWVSTNETLRDFIVVGWPVLILFGAGVLLELLLRPSPTHRQTSPFIFGMLPGGLYVGLGILVAVAMDWW